MQTKRKCLPAHVDSLAFTIEKLVIVDSGSARWNWNWDRVKPFPFASTHCPLVHGDAQKVMKLISWWRKIYCFAPAKYENPLNLLVSMLISLCVWVLISPTNRHSFEFLFHRWWWYAPWENAHASLFSPVSFPARNNYSKWNKKNWTQSNHIVKAFIFNLHGAASTLIFCACSFMWCH